MAKLKENKKDPFGGQLDVQRLPKSPFKGQKNVSRKPDSRNMSGDEGDVRKTSSFKGLMGSLKQRAKGKRP